MPSGRVRRTVALMAGTALVGALMTGCGRAANADTEPDDVTAAVFKNSGELPERLAADGTTVVVGAPAADTAVHVYEDMRCPVCEEFEKASGQALRGMTVSGEIRTEYTLASFLDDRMGGKGSKKAANALRAALEQGKFLELHDVLFAHQPEESTDGYTDAFLLRMASKVDGLRGKEFDTAVRTMKYRNFVTASQKAYERDKVDGTPGFAVNGTLVSSSLRGFFFDPKLLPSAVQLSVVEPSADLGGT